MRSKVLAATRRTRWRLAIVLLAAVGGVFLAPRCAPAQNAAPFEKLAGRWLGDGLLGIRNGATEKVTCRVTYIVAEQGQQLRQTIRCATDSASVEVQSMVTHTAGTLKGTWKELSRDMSGDLSGSVTANGYKVAIRGSELNANMEIIERNNKQIIEVQFITGSLIGLTLQLTKR